MKINIDQKNNKVTIDLTQEEMDKVAVNGIASLFPAKVQYVPIYTSPNEMSSKKDWGDDAPYEWWRHPLTCELASDSSCGKTRHDAREEL